MERLLGQQREARRNQSRSTPVLGSLVRARVLLEAGEGTGHKGAWWGRGCSGMMETCYGSIGCPVVSTCQDSSD